MGSMITGQPAVGVYNSGRCNLGGCCKSKVVVGAFIIAHWFVVFVIIAPVPSTPRAMGLTLRLRPLRKTGANTRAAPRQNTQYIIGHKQKSAHSRLTCASVPYRFRRGPASCPHPTRPEPHAHVRPRETVAPSIAAAARPHDNASSAARQSHRGTAREVLRESSVRGACHGRLWGDMVRYGEIWGALSLQRATARRGAPHE